MDRAEVERRLNDSLVPLRRALTEERLTEEERAVVKELADLIENSLTLDDQGLADFFLELTLKIDAEARRRNLV